MPRIGLKCALPLNNPFITDVLTTPILLPDGLSATHTHLELGLIFTATCPPQTLFGANSTANNQTATAAAAATGPRLYQSVLRAAYAKTLPVDFVELAGVLDVVYVTPTSVGIISTKRTLLYDRLQPGYARATNLIQCPAGFFGMVGGVCMPCADFRKTAGVSVPVAYQIQCNGGEFETFTIVASKNLSADDVNRGLCIYTTAKNGSCPSQVSVASPQPFNMAADALDAGAPSASTVGLVRCLMTEAERTTGQTLFRSNSAEYNARVVSQGRHILDAAAGAATLPMAAVYSSASDASAAKGCRSTIVSGVGGFLQCALPKIPPIATAGGRRLMQQQAQPPGPPSSMIEHQGPVYASNIPISWNLVLAHDNTGQITNVPVSSRRDGASDNALPMWALILIVGIASVVVLSLATYLLFHRTLLHAPPPAVVVHQGAQFRLGDSAAAKSAPGFRRSPANAAVRPGFSEKPW